MPLELSKLGDFQMQVSPILHCGFGEIDAVAGRAVVVKLIQVDCQVGRGEAARHSADDNAGLADITVQIVRQLQGEVIPFFLSGDNLFPADQLAGRPILRIDLHVAGHAVSRRAGHDAEMHGLAGIDKG